jgi:hypothetical protein
MSAPDIYHCTPMTPRAALEELGVGRNFCVSFWRPDDCEVVERVASTVMFRQRGVFRMAGGHEARRGMVRSRGLVALLSLAGTTSPWQSLGHHTGRSRRTLSGQRWSGERVAVWDREGGSGVAHGWPCLTPAETVRPLPDRVHRMDRDRRRQGGRLHSMVRTDVRNCAGNRGSVAAASPPSRRACSARVPICERGRQQRRPERMAV